MQDGPLQRYRSMVFKGELAPDTAQELAAEKLQLLGNRLAQYTEPRLGDLLNPFKRRVAPEGLYLYGGVGRGKTLLLDLFFEAVPFTPKRRVHFQEFMAEAHDAIERARKAAADPIASAAEEITSSAALLCFDELEITDIADAMILGRLFQHLFASNVVIVATSNTPPGELYRGRLNRPLFQPYIALIEQRMETHELEAAKDYRLEKLQGNDLYLTPADARAGAAMDLSWRKTHGAGVRGSSDPQPQGPQRPRAASRAWGRSLLLCRSLRGAAWAPRLSAHRPHLSYADGGGDPGARPRAAQRRAAPHYPDRRALRQRRRVDRLG